MAVKPPKWGAVSGKSRYPSLWNGMTFCVPGWNDELIDLVNSITGTQVDTDGSGTHTWVDTPHGRGLQMNQGTNNDNGAYVWWDVGELLGSAHPFCITLVIRTMRADAPGIMCSVGVRDHGDNNDWAIRCDDITSAPEGFLRDEGTPLFVTGSTDIIDPTAENLYVITYRGVANNNHRLIVNGTEEATSATVRSKTTAITTVTWNTDTNTAAPSGFIDGVWHSMYVHNRDLTDAEIAALAADPWVHLRRRASRRRSMVAMRRPLLEQR